MTCVRAPRLVIMKTVVVKAMVNMYGLMNLEPVFYWAGVRGPRLVQFLQLQ